jgi:uncharacterized phage protein gp47/JayE
MGQLSTTGYSVRTLAAIKTLVQSAFNASWPGIDLSEEGPEGNWINWLSEWLYNNDIDGLGIFNQLDLNNAVGVWLSFLAILRGTQRNNGTKAVINVTLTSSTQPYTIPALSKFNLLDSDLVFENLTDISVTSTSQTAQFICTANGETGAEVGNKLSAVGGGLTALTDIEISSITDGTDNESDEILRARLQAQNSLNSNSDVDAIYTALRNLTNTIKAVVYDNDTGGTVDSIPAYNINAVVLGSTDQQIADVLRVKKPAGTPTYGAYSASSIDSKGYVKVQYFDRPDKVDVYIAASVTTKPGQATVDASYDAVIRSNCKTFVNSLDIGKDVSYTTVFGFFAFPAINPSSIPVSPFDITHLYLSKTSPSADLQASNLDIGSREYGWITDENSQITIRVI